MNIVRLNHSGAEIFSSASTHETHKWINSNGYVAVSLFTEGGNRVYFVMLKSQAGDKRVYKN